MAQDASRHSGGITNFGIGPLVTDVMHNKIFLLAVSEDGTIAGFAD